MSSEVLIRTRYRDVIPIPNTHPPQYNVRSAPNPTEGEVCTDMETYYQALERVHGSGPHSFGIASGLGVTAVVGQLGFRVLPGIAIDLHGRHISLAEGSKFEVGVNASAEGSPPDTFTVAANGAFFDTTGRTGDLFVTIQWFETFDWQTLSDTGTIYRELHTPWIRLQDVIGFVADGNSIVLARLKLDNAGNVTSLTEDHRWAVGLPVGGIRVRRGYTKTPAPNVDIEDTVSASLDPRHTGGLDVTVPANTDEIHLKAGAGNFASLDVSANLIVGRHPDTTPTVILDTGNATALLGNQGHGGHADVRGPNNQYSVFLNGDTGHIITGGPGLTGEVRVKDANATDSIWLEAGAGDVWFRGKLRDPHGAHAGIGHDRLSHLPELEDGGFTNLHRHHVGDASSPVWATWFWANRFNSVGVQIEVNLGSPRHVMAYIAISWLDNVNGGYDADDGSFAEIFAIDGVITPWQIADNSWKLGPPGADANGRSGLFIGTAQRIKFRLRSIDDTALGAIAVIYAQP